MADPQHPDPGPDPLAAELRALGQRLTVAEPTADLAAAVLARLPARPPRASVLRRAGGRVAGWPVRARRIVVAVLLAVTLGLAAATPAAAQFARWIGLGGVVVVETPGDPGPPPDPGSAPVPGEALTVRQAGERAGFAPGVPAELGEPDRVSVSPDGEVVTMEWGPPTAGAPALLLQQFVGGPAPTFAKRYHDIVEYMAVDGAEALWLARPHTLEYLDATGQQRITPSRTSGPALVWQRGELTLRLEGEPDRVRALVIAASVR